MKSVQLAEIKRWHWSRFQCEFNVDGYSWKREI